MERIIIHNPDKKVLRIQKHAGNHVVIVDPYASSPFDDAYYASQINAIIGSNE